MNTIANTTVSKLSVAFVAVAMLFTLAAPAKAATMEELQAQIAALMAQISALSSSSSTGAGAAGCTFTRALTVGSEGSDVNCLQNYLTSTGHYSFSGGSTGYFGPVTASAVAAWQGANGVSPAVGYFGPVSQAKYSMIASVSTPDTDDSDDDSSSSDLSGEASLDAFDVEDGSDDEVEEGEEGEIAELTVEFTNGDASISRLDIALLEAAETGTSNTQPWRAFETVSLWVDGDMVAEMDASDEDDYLDEDDGSLRFTGLDIVAMEDEEVEITVMVSVQNSVDADEVTDWELFVLEMRYFDADGVATTENSDFDLSGNETAGTGPVAEFAVVVEGTNDDATIESSSDNPDVSTLLVEEDTADSDEYEIFMFEIETDEESGALELDDITIDLLISNPTGGIDTTVPEIIEEVTLTINGQTEDGSATTSSSDTDDTELGHVIAATESNRVAYIFEFDGLELDGDEIYEAVLSVTFKGRDVDATPDAYSNGVTVQAFVDGSEAELEGSEGSNVLSGTEQSETHTLSTVVPIITNVDDTVSVDDPNNSGTISFEFTVEADEDDVVLTFADVDGVILGGSDDVRFTITGTDTSIGTGTITRVSGDAEISGQTWVIEEGDTATFALDVTFATVGTGDNGTYRVTLDSVEGVEIDMTSGPLNLSHS